ncbi:phenylalanine--tRNA ligase subunit beta [Granulosicoccaceae sp. 1_MG-2023]|nr:phenylalanine--tRNA ligase subunit beta [Granulosicoccaceae sp. 1_MG-2023]
MKFSENWLREWVNPAISSDELVAQLTLLGLEVDDVTALGGLFSGVVVGEIVAIEQHPDADRLRVCQVAGGEEVVQVVCGAPNAALGLKTAFATVGAVLPGNFKIKKAKLRGQPSFGMLCSGEEIGLSSDADGIMELPADAPVGTPLAEYLGLDDTVIDIDITPNRSDCFSIRGVARDISARNDLPLAKTLQCEVSETSAAVQDVSVEPGSACVRYCGRVIEGVDNTKTTPLWMAERLRRGGVRPISPLVDVTNYVMLELGQPMHAFDRDRLSGAIRVRRAAAKEPVKLLDGRDIKLDDDTTVIADDSGVIGVAGIMGGDSTGCEAESRNVFLESALFLPEMIAGRSRRYAMHTESGHRFERGVDPQLQREALDYATALILEICGGQAGPVTEVLEEPRLPVAEPILLRRERIERILGFVVPAEEVEILLSRLGVELSAHPEGWTATVPGYRYDLRIEVDLIEEIARVYGYDKLPDTQPVLSPTIRPVADLPGGIWRAREVLVERGFQEVVTYSFVDPQLHEALCPGVKALPLANPISTELAEMRLSLLPGLVSAFQRNVNRQIQDLRLFESGLRFLPGPEGLEQRKTLAGLISGRAAAEHWSGEAGQVDFYTMKGHLESVFNAVHAGAVTFTAAAQPGLHPGQSATVLVDGQACGVIGTLHPSLVKQLDLQQPAYVFEIDQEVLERDCLPAYEEISRFPSVRRDIAVLFDESTSMGDVERTVLQNAPGVLRKLVVFDIYRGEKIASGLKSVALGLILQDNSRTLDEGEVEKTVAGIIKVLEEKFGATLRM